MTQQVQSSPSSALIQKKQSFQLVLLGILCCVTIVIFIASNCLGSYQISVPDVFRAIFLEKEGTSHAIIWNVRVPRNLVGACAGACLALAGTILQGVMKNPLASPNIIGVSSGAGLGAMISLVLLPELAVLLTPIAFVMGFLTTVIIYFLSYREGIKPLRMVLAGIAVSSFLGAINNTILIFYADRVQSALGFMIGTLAAKTWGQFQLILPYTLVGMVFALFGAGKMNVLALGDEMATGLGLHVERTRFLFIALASLLAAASVSVIGILGFVGLIVPHLVRLLIGSDHTYLFPASAICGAALVMACDTIARTIFMPIEIPVGIVMAIIGAPFFLYLLRRRKVQ